MLLQYILSAVQHVILRMLLMQCIWSGTLHVGEDKESKRVKKELKKGPTLFSKVYSAGTFCSGWLLVNEK